MSAAGRLRCLRLDAGGRYRQARPRVPRVGEVPVPEGVVSFWSETLALYLYVQDGWVRLHDPRRGLLKSGGEWEEAWAVEKKARLAAEQRIAALEAELQILRPS